MSYYSFLPPFFPALKNYNFPKQTYVEKEQTGNKILNSRPALLLLGLLPWPSHFTFLNPTFLAWKMKGYILQHSDSSYRISKWVTNFRIPGFSFLICCKNRIGDIELYKKIGNPLFERTTWKDFLIVIQKSFIYNRCQMISYAYRTILWMANLVLKKSNTILQHKYLGMGTYSSHKYCISLSFTFSFLLKFSF